MCRVLFVDDEPRVLQGLRRALHVLGTDWEADYAVSADEALLLLERQTYDVVVSDIRMPGMSGSELLAEVMRRWPSAVRVVLSGQADEEAVLNTVTSSHLFLQKPCEAAALDAAIRAALSTRRLLNRPELASFVSQIGALPSPPGIYVELLRELRSEEPSLARAAAIVGRNPALGAKILHLVNSAYFGFFGKVVSLDRAIAFLGFNTLKAVVLSVEAFAVADRVPTSCLDVCSLFEHSFTVARYAQEIARLTGCNCSVDAAFTAGLLHDIGKVILATRSPERYSEIAPVTRQGGLAGAQVEAEVLGGTHAEVGAYLLALWGLPDEVVDAVAFHHAPPTDGPCPAIVVHLADAFARAGSQGEPDLSALPEGCEAREKAADLHAACERLTQFSAA
ncbi:MAG: HDOD domain-containing protein [Fimbriimonadia bacterium]|jgi:putative nucleotidyltransferase with HDIG domain